MKPSTTYTNAIDFLRQDLLRNIVPLKMLAAHPEAIDIYYAQNNSGSCLLLLFPTTTFAYDRQHYAQDDYIAILAGTTGQVYSDSQAEQRIVEQLLSHIPSDKRIVFKLPAGSIREALTEQLPLRRVTAVRSYTATAEHVYPMNEAVCESDQLDERLFPHLATFGHDRQDLDHLFRSAGTRSFTLYRTIAGGNSVPLAACFTYENFEQIHEIGGVVTIPEERRKGYAKRVVEHTVATLLQRDLLPRYQVHEENVPSVRLAEQVGLTLFVTTEHWYYQPS